MPLHTRDEFCEENRFRDRREKSYTSSYHNKRIGFNSRVDGYYGELKKGATSVRITKKRAYNTKQCKIDDFTIKKEEMKYPETFHYSEIIRFSGQPDISFPAQNFKYTEYGYIVEHRKITKKIKRMRKRDADVYRYLVDFRRCPLCPLYTRIKKICDECKESFHICSSHKSRALLCTNCGEKCTICRTVVLKYSRYLTRYCIYNYNLYPGCCSGCFTYVDKTLQDNSVAKDLVNIIFEYCGY